MTSAYLNHLTLIGGDLRQSPADEVPDQVITDLAERIADVMEAGQPFPLDPPFDGYTLAVTRYGAALYAELRRDGVALVTMGIAARDRAGRGLWVRMVEEMETTYPGLPVPRCPAAPWLAVLPHLPLMDDPAIEWAGDFERCLAWAWIRKR